MSIRRETLRLLLVHSHETLRVDSMGRRYTTGSLTREVWDRYLAVCGELTACFRRDRNVHDAGVASRIFQPLDRDDVRFAELPHITKGIGSFLNLNARLRRRKLLEAEIRACDAAIIRVPGDASTVAATISQRLGRPYMLEVVGCAWDSLWNHSLRGKCLAPVSYLRMRRIVRSAPFVMYVTEAFLQRRYPTSGRPYACSDVALPEADDLVLENRLRRIADRSSRPGEKVVLGTTAAVDVRYKGHDQVIKAIALLAGAGLNYEYRVAGGGDHSHLTALARKLGVEDRVVFLGGLTHNEVFHYLDTVDIYIQPSRQEGLARALIEALSRACPAIVSDAGGNPELIHREWTYPVGDVGALVKLIRRMDCDAMSREAVRNFSTSTKFEKNSLEERRSKAMRAFAEAVVAARSVSPDDRHDGV